MNFPRITGSIPVKKLEKRRLRRQQPRMHKMRVLYYRRRYMKWLGLERGIGKAVTGGDRVLELRDSFRFPLQGDLHQGLGREVETL